MFVAALLISMFGKHTEERWSFYVSGPVSQLGISQLWLYQMVLPYVSVTFPQLSFCHLFTYLLDQLLIRTDGTTDWSSRNKDFIGKEKYIADGQRKWVISKYHTMWRMLPVHPLLLCFIYSSAYHSVCTVSITHTAEVNKRVLIKRGY